MQIASNKEELHEEILEEGNFADGKGEGKIGVMNTKLTLKFFESIFKETRNK